MFRLAMALNLNWDTRQVLVNSHFILDLCRHCFYEGQEVATAVARRTPARGTLTVRTTVAVKSSLPDKSFLASPLGLSFLLFTLVYCL